MKKMICPIFNELLTLSKFACQAPTPCGEIFENKLQVSNFFRFLLILISMLFVGAGVLVSTEDRGTII